MRYGWQQVRRSALLLLIAGFGLGCDGDRYQEHLAGQSAHFRLWADDALSAPVDADATLKGLEDNWSSVGAMLSVPSGTIDYHLATHDDVVSQCDHLEFVRACTAGTAIYSPDTFDQHELNHAYMALRSPHRPALFVIEGLAEAVGCYDGSEAPPPYPDADQWGAVVPSTYAGPADVYASGRRLMRYLIVNFGVSPVLSYYEQAPSGADAQAFADNFSQFWSMTLDQAWGAMQTPTPGGTSLVLPVCPCSAIPSLPTDPGEQPVVASSGDLYWSLSDNVGGETVALSTLPEWTVSISDCNRERIDVAQTNLLFARAGSGFYVSADRVSVMSGAFVSDTCADAVAYDVTNANGFGVALDVSVEQPSTVYLLLNSSSPRTLTSPDSAIGVCSSCDFSSQPCQPQPIATAVTLSGPTYVSLSLPVGAATAYGSFTLSP